MTWPAHPVRQDESESLKQPSQPNVELLHSLASAVREMAQAQMQTYRAIELLIQELRESRLAESQDDEDEIPAGYLSLKRR